MKDLSINISILKSWRYHRSTRYIPINYDRLKRVNKWALTLIWPRDPVRSFPSWQDIGNRQIWIGERGGGKRETIFLPLPVHIRSEHVWCNYWKTSIFNRPLENWFLWSRVTRRGFNLIRGGYLPWNLRLANNIEGLIFWTIVEKSVGGTDLSFFLPFGWLFHGFSSLSKHGDCSQIGKGGRYVSSCYQL